MSKSKPAIYAFIDSQNLNLAIKDQGWDLDFGRFFTYLKDKYKVSKAFIFIGYVPGNEAIYTFLQKTGFIVIFKPTLEYKKRGKAIIKGNVDAELVLHAMIEYRHYDSAIIITGDGDFHCFIEYLEANNKLKYIIIPNERKYSALLRNFRKYFKYLTGLKMKLQRQKKRGSNLRTEP